ncbi:MAG: ATP-binding protein [Desulforhopalus sp.]
MAGSYPYEKLGLFYLGREVDLDSGAPTPQPLLLKNKSITTHGAIIGMTGSGKTGLGIALIEEAIMDNIPSIIIDPKGDMGNLLLTFPECKPADFLPWVDPAEAANKELSAEQYAAKTAETWKKGLESWGQGTDRIGELRSKGDLCIYTPGSSAGLPVSVLSSFQAPAEDVLADTDTLNSLVNSTTASLLALIDIVGDPLQSREHILLSSLLLHYWRLGQDLSMETLISNIVSPPFDKVGFFPLDTYYPQQQRMGLAMLLNNILASPTFSSWTEGEPLDIQKFLYSENGRPRTAIFSISHLSDTERMFFVTMLLNQFIGWMRKQPGASSLKALLYMDEIYGYFPPTANPPSKKPMMLLLKQARAYGVGVLLATQNPVDLDYKGLSNIGSWFIGRLQTRQDQERVVEGIVGASDGTLETGQVRELLADMKGRRFLLNSAHLEEPVHFETRWVMSYLKGPISKKDIKKLMAGRKQENVLSTDQPSRLSSPAVREVSQGATFPPVVSSAIEQRFYLQNVVSEEVRFEPWLAARASVRFFNAKRNIDIVTDVDQRLYLDASFSNPAWESSETAGYSLDVCRHEPPSESIFYPLPSGFEKLKNLRGLTKDFADYLYQNKKLELFRVQGTRFESEPNESLADFKVRFSDYLREEKDAAVEQLRKKYKTKQDRLEQKMNRALDKVAKEKIDVRAKTTDSLISFGVAVVGAFFGRKTFSTANIGKAATGMRSVGRVAKEKSDVKRAEDAVLEIQNSMEQLAVEIEEKIVGISDSFTLESHEIEIFAIKPRRSDIFDVDLLLLWEMVA